ncbi:MAG: tripartite tricarboxylate transporter substrate binding protein [Burkholderiales bacterium]|nr:tripartite tricarboxylate transporter substrate binding protein [Burkholderiales bacterium]
MIHSASLKSCAAPIRRRAAAGGLVAACIALASPVAAQEAFPSRPLRLIVSVGAGGATDVLTRTMGERLSRLLGVNVLVENQPAGSGVVAAQAVARAAPDGHTLLIGTNTTHAGNASFLKNLPYDPVNDFEPISRMGIAALVLSLNSAVPAANVQEFIAHAKANPGRIGFGSGTGSARLASEMLKARAGIDILSVPYKSNAQALTDLRGGQIQMLFGDIALMLPHIRSGAVKGLAVSSARRSATMPELPTMQEAGVAGYELVGFIAAFAPAKTPEAVVRRLSEEINRILREKEVVDRLVALGVDAAPTTPAELREWVINETRKWRDLARGAGIQPE